MGKKIDIGFYREYIKLSNLLAFNRNRIEENKKAYKYKPRYEHARARKKRLAKEAAEGYNIDFNCLI